MSISAPPQHGSGSGKAAWVEYCAQLTAANHGLSDVNAAQSETIRDLEAEIALLKEQIQTRKPKGGRPALDLETVNRIEQAIEHGAESFKAIARRFSVSDMSVRNIRDRMNARESKEMD